MQAQRRYLAATSAALLALVLFTTGCGHSGASRSASGSSQPAQQSKGSSSSSKPAVAEFRSSATAICQAINSELEASKPSSTSIAELLRFTPRHVAMERKGLIKLEALQAPSSLATPWQQMIGYRKELLSQLDELAHEAQSRDQAKIKRLTASKLKLHTALQKVGVQLGSAACGKLG